MTPEQKNKVITLRKRFANRRDVVLLDWSFCSDIEQKARVNTEVTKSEYYALDSLVNAPDENLLAIVEATQ